MLREGSGHRVPSLATKISATNTSWQREKWFLQQSFPRYNNHNSGQDSCPGVVAQCKRNTMIFLCTFSFSVFWHSFIVLIFCLFVLILVSVFCRIYLLIFVFSCVFIFVPCGFCSFACLLLKERTHQVGWGGSGKNWQNLGNGKHDQNTLNEIFLIKELKMEKYSLLYLFKKKVTGYGAHL